MLPQWLPPTHARNHRNHVQQCPSQRARPCSRHHRAAMLDLGVALRAHGPPACAGRRLPARPACVALSLASSVVVALVVALLRTHSSGSMRSPQRQGRQLPWAFKRPALAGRRPSPQGVAPQPQAPTAEPRGCRCRTQLPKPGPSCWLTTQLQLQQPMQQWRRYRDLSVGRELQWSI